MKRLAGQERIKRTFVAFIALALAVVGASCGSGASTSPTSEVDANLFKNGSFENGADPWISLTTEAWGTPFAVSSHVAHGGQHSAYLALRAPADAQGAQVFGVVQELSPEHFPEVLSGYYYVESWQRGTPKQYLQFVVVAFGVTNLPGGYANHQVRYLLAGINEEPFPISNAKFVFLTKEDPRQGQWVYFERPIARDFEELWGAAPQGFDKLRILFEVRYDDKVPGTEGSADVYYDDLYLGPAADNPNHP